MAITINDNFSNNSPKHLDAKYAPGTGASAIYASTAAAIAAVPSAYRAKGLTVFVTVGGSNLEYWWRDGILDGDLILKTPVISYDEYLLAANDTIDNPQPILNGQTYTVKITQGGTGNYTVTWDTKFKFSLSQPEPVLSTDVGAIDILRFIYDLTDDTFYCVSQSLGFNQSV